MLNREVFATDPTTFRIPNNGVARVGVPGSAQEWETLRWELQSFVCEGEYRSGLERILSTYLSRLGKEQQPAVWVSGFFGSGKSHLVRVLDAVWRDLAFPDGASARGLVNLPADIKPHLAELSTAGKREGGLWSAAGTLSAGVGSSVRLAVLALVFRAAGLPEKYAQARFVLWLKAEGHHAAVERELKTAGRSLSNELTNMYVSRHLAEAMRKAIPGIATTNEDVHLLLREQYKDVTEVLSDELLATLRAVFKLQSTAADRMPLVLLVLDELQQFLAEDPARTLELQDVVERSSSQFEGRLLFVATGQMQLSATPALQKLRDRFTVTVALKDSDVDRVVRSVVLRKDPRRVGDIDKTLSSASGEIHRQLAGSKIAHQGSDDADLVADYPLLPARRRLWEAILRSVDSFGKAGQLRAQLRIVLEATQEVASSPLGHVIPGDAIYDPIVSDLQQSGMLPRDTATLIERLPLSGTGGELRGRVAKLAFLLSKLEERGPGATGVRATAEVFADLLVEDLRAGGADIRRQVGDVVTQLVADGTLLDVDGQYLLQTPVAAEWFGAYGHEFTRLKNDASWIADHRTQALKTSLTVELGKLTVQQGKAKVSRKAVLAFGDSPPQLHTGEISIWVRDGWSTSVNEVLKDAQSAGVDSPTVFVFIPRQDADALRDALAASGAAANVVDGRPMPQTDEGIQARTNIVARGNREAQRSTGMLEGLLTQARVFQGGGNEILTGRLRTSVEQAVLSSATRLFPQFDLADFADWGKVIERAKQGNASPLSAIGYAGDVDKQPACAEVLRFVSGTTRTGKEVRAKFTGATYGWEQDAVDAALYALSAAGMVRAKVNNQPTVLRNTAQNALGTIFFQAETAVVPTTTKVEVKALAQALGVPVASIAESEIVPQLLVKLMQLANAAGGEAPLPRAPSIDVVQALQALTGNDQLLAVHNKRSELMNLSKQWIEQGKKVPSRIRLWEELQELLARMDDGPVKQEVTAQVAAISQNRSLLVEPDPVTPLAQRVSDDLRRRLVKAWSSYDDAFADAGRELDADPTWQELERNQRDEILAASHLAEHTRPSIETNRALLDALRTTDVSNWQSRTVALPGRVMQARAEAARLRAPESVVVHPPSATIRTEPEMRAYLDALEETIIAHLRAGKPVIL
jgi:hypothetical protein